MGHVAAVVIEQPLLRDGIEEFFCVLERPFEETDAFARKSTVDDGEDDLDCTEHAYRTRNRSPYVHAASHIERPDKAGERKETIDGGRVGRIVTGIRR